MGFKPGLFSLISVCSQPNLIWKMTKAGALILPSIEGSTPFEGKKAKRPDLELSSGFAFQHIWLHYFYLARQSLFFFLSSSSSAVVTVMDTPPA